MVGPATSAVGCIIQTDFVVTGKHNFELVALQGSMYGEWRLLFKFPLIRFPPKMVAPKVKWSFAEYLIQPRIRKRSEPHLEDTNGDTFILM